MTLPELSVEVHYGIHSLRGSAASLRNALIDACHTLLPWAGAVTPTTVAQYTGIILKLHKFSQPAAAEAAGAPALPAPRNPPPRLPGEPPHRAAVSEAGGQAQAAGPQRTATDPECGRDIGVGVVMGAEGGAPPPVDEIRAEMGLVVGMEKPSASDSTERNPPSTMGSGKSKRPGKEIGPPQMLLAQELATTRRRALRMRP